VLFASEVKIVGRGVDTLVLNVCNADKLFQPIKQELNDGWQEVLSTLQGEARINESAVVTNWAFIRVQSIHAAKGVAWTMAVDTDPSSRLAGSAQSNDRASAPFLGIPLVMRDGQ
jgi:hypothetical protein